MTRDPAKATELQGTLKKLLLRYAPKRPAAPDQVSPATRALLGSLGYLSGGPKTTQNVGADPKDKLPVFQQYERCELLLADRRLDDAIALLSKLLASDPARTCWRAAISAPRMSTSSCTRRPRDLLRAGPQIGVA